MPVSNPTRPGGPSGPRRPGNRRQVWSTVGGPKPLPQVVTVGSSLQTSTANTSLISATLVGSINTLGQAGTWWFNYGTSPTLGTTTSSAAASASVLPQTVTTVLTSLQLTEGLTYYFALVGSTAGGTVTGNTLSFTYALPDEPFSPSTAVVSSAASSVSIPHLAWPFTLVTGTQHTGRNKSNDGAKVVEQDSDGDIYSCVSAILACQVGQWPESPAFGINDQAFTLAGMSPTGTPQIDTLGIATTISRWEPRATSSIVSLATSGDPTDGNFTIAAEVR